MRTDLSRYDNSWYNAGAGVFKRLVWYFTNVLFLKNPLSAHSGFKVLLLRIFGAKIGKGVVIKPGVSVKYPWLLNVGDYTWIGENVWIDNLAKVIVGSNVCISQGAMLLCGNHNYKSAVFDLTVKPIIIEDGAWIGARSTICPGATVHSHGVLTVGSIATKDMDSLSIYRGNPAIKVAERIFFES